MVESWTSPSVLVAAIAAAAAVVGAILSWLVFRHQRREADTAPQVNCQDIKHTDRPGWYCVIADLTNYSALQWMIESVDLIRPSDGGIAGAAELRENVSPGTWAVVLPTSSDRRHAHLNHKIAVGGISRQFERDEARVELYVFSPALTDRRLSFRLNLRSMEAMPRRRKITIKRTLPLPISSKDMEVMRRDIVRTGQRTGSE